MQENASSIATEGVVLVSNPSAAIHRCYPLD